ncbi:methylglyoxal synthase [Rhodobacteraceae bacterium RKSG542]|uniref:methylglyoxal synthase n=1 Tax=Pseudovibrio flavus TaxID=2529854 RepID=UPI0012BBB75A|nr:methylglyoxal synthase [Pseudovibrio flavus]MTI17218.1 methylglyoxal synthase [Pseudovibrio flavus]
MEKPRALALIAHDAKKDEMVSFVSKHREKLKDYDLYATGTTGGRILEACPELTVTRMKSGPLGGDQQIGGMIAEGKLDGLFFFVDPLSPMPHDVDVKALMRLALVYDLPMALNRSTAGIILRSSRLAGLSSTSSTPEAS